MSELIQKNDNRATIRWKLLTGASALALTAYISSANVSKAEDADRPLIWIELGGQMENVSGQGATFAPDFLSKYSTSPVLQSVTPIQAQKPEKFSFGENGSISFQPKDSDWLFSAAVRIGRSSNFRHVDHQTKGGHYLRYKYTPEHVTQTTVIQTTANFADTHAHRRESHAILDFSAGKDVGLGIFGKENSSVLSLGVRFAQFTSAASFDVRARPDLQLEHLQIPTYGVTLNLPYFHTYHASGHASRSFRGMGPSLSWSGSSAFAGNPQDSELTLDWGINAAFLFGKQKATVQHHESGHYKTALNHYFGNSYVTVYQHNTPIPPRSRNVTVPNVGGSVGLSWRVQDFKVSLGYRYDMFLKAMDTGIDARKNSNLTFNGPYASISIGLGD